MHIQGSSINKNPIVILCKGAIFVTKSSCIVARMVLYDTVGLHLPIFRILEPYLSKDISLDLSHVISH